ncbi:protease inhibitor [Saccharopolyspora indica]|uniref:SSI family serine proteinase inhibitor n=1 Tax=Saccharopolyspora indica TaxID=1229659 RepID=UPI0022EB41A5|nr:SSI family serine proteinase inhibitor [Saccharopolyspora indica]MDA3647691.1 SSI family serine proteinase inhibitor [Saccharopolyspora indica]
MSEIRLLGRAAAGVACAVAVLIPGAAAAAGEQSTVTLSVTETNQQTRSVTLNCDPVGGDHPQAGAACHQLQLVDGNFQRLDARTASNCTKDRRAVSAEAKGNWRGKPVEFRLTAANSCSLKARTGALFDF